MESPHWLYRRLLILSLTATVSAWLAAVSEAQPTLVSSLEEINYPETLSAANLPRLMLAKSQEEGPISAAITPLSDSWEQRPISNTGYDNGFFIKSANQASSPFLLRTNLQFQFRLTNFGPQQPQWEDSAGRIRPIQQRNDFDINRGRVIFSGNAVDPDLNYYVNLDYSTLGGDRVTILLAWLNYRFHRAFELYFGKGKVPGGREWLVTSMATQAPDRSMATTFFRPSITTGIWARGEPVDKSFYQFAIGNGFNTAAAGFRELDTNFVYSANLWREPLGDFGLLYSDWQWSPTPVVRWGGSLTSSRQSGTQVGSPVPEDTFIRLSDGTDLTVQGALAPGVTVTDYTVSLATMDFGLKYKGYSLHGEYFFRWLSDIIGNGPIPSNRRSLFDHGFLAMGGHFLIPKTWEIYLRNSNVFGPFGGGNEYAGGMNWFVKGKQNWRFTLDAAYLHRSPTEQLRTGYEVGASGMLFRAQMQATF
jgi:hypothetical protein